MQHTELMSAIGNTIRKGGPGRDEFETFTVHINKLGELISQNRLEPAALEALTKDCHFLRDTESIMGHIRQKPFGYAGDFYIIDRIYTRQGSQQYSKWDTFSLENTAAEAVRNRKAYFKKCMSQRLKGEASLLNIASGPARDLYELLQEQPNPQLSVTCVEMDANAIEFAKKLNNRFLHQIEFVKKNIFRFQTSKQYDVIWSAGLFDYFDDRAFVLLLQRFGQWLKPGGEIIIGNFNDDHNPSRTFMEVFGDWNLNHRTEAQLIDLARQAGFSEGNIYVGREPENVNLFLHIKVARE